MGWRAVLLAVCVSALAGCHTLRIRVSDAPSVSTPIVDRKTFWLFGCFPKWDVDVSAICPDGVGWIEERTTFTDGLLTLVTLEIYTPRTTSYYCRQPQEVTSP